ncbi:hypothetical protein G7054_g3652 [Neopestalotiopsis clavispora]|nr:hypothetical protein G7054_g3652 [Neopestalotiopsis clavispora]
MFHAAAVQASVCIAADDRALINSKPEARRESGGFEKISRQIPTHLNINLVDICLHYGLTMRGWCLWGDPEWQIFSSAQVLVLVRRSSGWTGRDLSIPCLTLRETDVAMQQSPQACSVMIH